MFKKMVTLTLTVALVLAQATMAGAFVSDGTQGPFTAAVTIGGTPVAGLTVQPRHIAGNGIATGIGWSNVNIGDEWKVSDQYLLVLYNANQVGWGVQIYTDNLSGTANPQYAGDPTTDSSQQPNGLIGVDNSLITCPLVALVADNPIAVGDIAIPVKTSSGTPGQADYVEWFTTGYDEIPGGAHEKVWFWLKDKSGTDYNLDPTFSSTGDDYATIVNTLGTSSGWAAPGTGEMLRDNSSASPILVYLAADFTNANELQEYKTNTLELEIYHE